MAFTATYNLQKPMAISSITSPLSSSSSSPAYRHYHNGNYKPHHLISFVHYTNTTDAEQPSTTVAPAIAENKWQQRPTPSFSYSSSESTSFSSSYTDSRIERSASPSSSLLYTKSNQSRDENNNSSSTLSPALHFSSVPAGGPLSLQERRQRNKTASAKYRAKKNQQHQGMRAMIHSMTKENDVLLRQLEQAKAENQQLKSICDKLRSKMMAEKMFKKILCHQRHPKDSDQSYFDNHAVFNTPPKGIMDNGNDENTINNDKHSTSIST